MPTDQEKTSMQPGEISRWAAQLLAIWLGVLLPIATIIQLSYVSKFLTRLPQGVVAALAFCMIGMITLSLWAAIGVWQGNDRIDARKRVNAALLASIAANMLCCAPLSILMSAPPTFLPVIILTLISFALLDAWHEPEQA